MDYYNLTRLIKNVVYNFTKMFKYLSISLICISFITICLLLMSTKSSAYSGGTAELITNNTTYNCDLYMPDNIYTVFTNTSYYTSGNYNYLCYLTDRTWTFQFFPKNSEIKVYIPSYPNVPVGFVGLSYSTTNGSSSCAYVTCTETNGTIITTATGLAGGNRQAYRPGYTTMYLITNMPIYTSSSLTNTVFAPTVSFIAPSFMPPDFSNNVQYLETGDFVAFQIDPGSVEKTDTIIFSAYEVINNEDSFLVTYDLNENSPFFLDSNPWNVSNADYSYFLTARFLSWFQIVNGKSYKVVLTFPNDGSVTSPVVYNWTITLTAAQIEQQNQQTNADINSGIQDLNNNISNVNEGLDNINNFLNDDTYNQNDIIDNIPSVTIPSNIDAENILDQLFNNLRSAFINEDSKDFVFVFPNSNGQSVTIPANYVETHLPDGIVTIIRIFYWFVISIYMFKYLWGVVDNVRQGDFTRSSENDIKTEVL